MLRHERASNNANAETSTLVKVENTNYSVSISRRSLIATVILCLALSFGAGCLSQPHFWKNGKLRMSFSSLMKRLRKQKGMSVGEISVYTFEKFDDHTCTSDQQLDNGTNGQQNSQNPMCFPYEQVFSDPDVEFPISRTGQHLIVDIEGVKYDHLNSDEDLSNAIIETAQETNMVLRSYHCHGIIPVGVTCIGLLGRGHITFHTWPDEGVITLDIFAWSLGEAKLREYLDLVVEKFGPSVDPENRKVSWNHKRRGFHPGYDMTDYEYEMEEAGWYYKKEVAIVETPFQKIEILEGTDGSSPTKTSVKRAVYLNGVIQSTSDGDAPYHEGLVHPAMFAHYNPERVAIIGGGEGATLREVLKHNTVKDAIMIEIDEKMIETSRTYLKQWNSCANIVGSSDCCFDDPRAHVYTEDALGWFIDRFYTSSVRKTNPKGLPNAEKMDVVIMDALAPSDNAEACDKLYSNDVFLLSLFNALTDDGILVIQLGETPELMDPPDSETAMHRRAGIEDELEQVGFDSIHIYDEGNCEFDAPWTYLVAFKDYETRRDWFANEAEIAVKLHERAMPTKNGESPFLHFDGTTMVGYQTPAAIFESTYCKEEPTPDSCKTLRGFDMEKPNYPISTFEVKPSGMGDKAGRGLYTTVDLPKNSYVGLEKSVEAVYFPPSTFELITEMEDELEEAQALERFDAYMHGYGYEIIDDGFSEVSVDSSALTFINHGCNGTYNVGWPHSLHQNATEWTVDVKHVPEWSEKMTLYNPVMDRRRNQMRTGYDETLRHIRRGEELLNNYLGMTANKHDWARDVEELREQCSGQGVGYVTQYEEEN